MLCIIVTTSNGAAHLRVPLNKCEKKNFMARSTTKTIDISKFSSWGKSGITVIKLMMCCNDMSLANQSLAKWKDVENLSKDEKSRMRGAGMYCVRMQLAHMFEGFKILEEIVQDPMLLNIVQHLDLGTRDAFKVLSEYLEGQPKRPELIKYIEKLRHKLTFHYDDSTKLFTKAISGLAEKQETRHSSITRGDSAFKWYFKVADDVVNHFVVRQIWAIPDTINSDSQTEEILVWTHSLFVNFMDFSGEFIWKCGES